MNDRTLPRQVQWASSMARVALAIEMLAALMLLWVDLTDHGLLPTPYWIAEPWTAVNIPVALTVVAISLSVGALSLSARSLMAQFSSFCAFDLLLISFMLVRC